MLRTDIKVFLQLAFDVLDCVAEKHEKRVPESDLVHGSVIDNQRDELLSLLTDPQKLFSLDFGANDAELEPVSACELDVISPVKSFKTQRMARRFGVMDHPQRFFGGSGGSHFAKDVIDNIRRIEFSHNFQLLQSYKFNRTSVFIIDI